jgi:hypothetical protein
MSQLAQPLPGVTLPDTLLAPSALPTAAANPYAASQCLDLRLPGASAAVPTARKSGPWIDGHWFDLLFVANWYWPLLVLFAVISTPALESTVGFWMVYMLLTPHRWITLPLVFLDRERYAERPRVFLGIAMFTALAILASIMTMPTLTMLLVADYLWNAWHFAAQHSGIGRIYARVAYPTDKGSAFWEKALLRTFIIYVILRLGAPLMADDRSLWLGWLDAVVPYMNWTDLPMMLIPCYLFGRDLLRMSDKSLGRVLYMASVLSLYSLLLLLAHFLPHGNSVHPVMAGALIAVTIFHSTEYLAIVSWTVKKRFANRDNSLMAHLAKRWTLTLAMFLLGLGVSAWLLSTQSETSQRVWFILNMFVSFLHYAYDGMIWKARPAKPAAAAA